MVGVVGVAGWVPQGWVRCTPLRPSIPLHTTMANGDDFGLSPCALTEGESRAPSYTKGAIPFAQMTEPATRRCSRCREELALECFYSTGGYCKECMREYNRLHAKRKRLAPESDSESDAPADPDADHSQPAAPEVRPQDLYIFANTLIPGILKIGRSGDVERRRLSMQQSHPFRLVTVATFPGAGHLEPRVHATLNALLVDGPGREWFHVSPSDAIHAIAIAMH